MVAKVDRIIECQTIHSYIFNTYGLLKTWDKVKESLESNESEIFSDYQSSEVFVAGRHSCKAEMEARLNGTLSLKNFFVGEKKSHHPKELAVGSSVES